ncbi:hypothetical protein GE061_011525 [Apolygus lucorum]|uniref:Uncharacterized protein n=1 Tax=Apolygus lucorum TaxID=248454 RepID=A0A8S9XY08_APOLU|nr:hypothetical protein GE061_011525 [Apolygus lucorum]
MHSSALLLFERYRCLLAVQVFIETSSRDPPSSSGEEASPGWRELSSLESGSWSQQVSVGASFRYESVSTCFSQQHPHSIFSTSASPLPENECHEMAASAVAPRDPVADFIGDSRFSEPRQL